MGGWRVGVVASVLLTVVAVAGCGDGSADPAPPSTTAAADQAAPSSSNAPDESLAEQPDPAEPVIREMTATEWELYSSMEDDGMVCPKPGTTAGEAFWDYEGDFDPSEFGRQPVDALNEAITELNNGRRSDPRNAGANVEDSLLPETGWVGLTHDDEGAIYFVYPEEEWEYIVLVSGDPAQGAWRHLKATICSAET